MPGLKETDKPLLTVAVKIFEVHRCNNLLSKMENSFLDRRSVIESQFCALGSNENIIGQSADACLVFVTMFYFFIK